jgi:EpsI family protein
MPDAVTLRNPAILQNPAIVLIALVLITLALYHETVGSLMRLWTDPNKSNYQHGLPLLGICIFLFYRRWVELGASRPAQPSLSAPALLLLVSLVWLVARLANSEAGQELTLILLISLVVASVVGYRRATVLAVPLAMLMFAVPIWEPLNPYLQQLTAHAVTVLLNLTGLPALLEGTYISVPAGTFDVRPACAGVTQVMVGTMVGAAFAYIRRLPPVVAFCVVATAAGVSVLTNTLRIYTTVIIGQLSGMHQYAFIKHWAPGWVLFGIGMFIFLFLADRWTPPPDPPGGTLSADAAGTVGSHGTGLTRSAMLGLSALVLGPALLYAYQSDRREIGALVLDLPAEIGVWRAATAPGGGYRPVFQNPDLTYESLYRDAQGSRARLHVAEYAYQEPDKLAVSYASWIYDESTWQPVLTRTRDLGDGATVAEARIQTRGGARSVVWQWYYVHGSAVSSVYRAKLLNAWGTLNKDPAIAVVVVVAEVEGSYESTEALLMRFVADTRPALERAIDRIRAH